MILDMVDFQTNRCGWSRKVIINSFSDISKDPRNTIAFGLESQGSVLSLETSLEFGIRGDIDNQISFLHTNPRTMVSWVLWSDYDSLLST